MSWQGLQGSGIYAPENISSSTSRHDQAVEGQGEIATYYNYSPWGGLEDSYGAHHLVTVSGPQGWFEVNTTANEPRMFTCSPPWTNWQIPRQKIIWRAGSGAPYLKVTELIWEKDAGVAWKANLRVKESDIYDGSNGRYSKTTYSLLDGIQLPTQVDEAKTKSDPVYRRSTTTYTSYPTQRILGLPLEVSTYEGAGTKLVARTTNSYDQSGGYTDSNGLALNYLLDESAAQVIQHDNTNYTTSLTQRGNLTSVTQSAVNSSGTVTGSRVIARTGYDTNGNVRWTTDAAGNRAQLLYTDNFLNKPASVGNTQALVYTAADPTGMRAGKQYDYWTGHLLKSFNLKPNSGTEEQIVTTSYDFADRPFQTIQPTGAWVKTFYWDNLLYLTTLQKTDAVGGVDQVGFSFTRTDGAGHTLGKGSDHPSGATGKYAGQKFVYNTRGEVSDQSNVEAMNASWTPIDEDAASGWLFQNYVYDEMGRIKQIARPDGNMYTIDRQGCGCAGATVTTTDERGCQVESKTDFLGRLESAKEISGYNTYGAMYYNSALYTYDVLGRLKQIDVKKGNNGAQTQTRTFVYDEYGRLQTETTPEAGAVNYSYTANDQLATKTDARGKVTTLAYNTRNLLTGVSYNDSTPGASYGYDEYGARTAMTDGEGTMSYVFDANRRLQSETRTFTGLASQTFTLTYGYNLGGQLKTVNYASSTGINKNVNYAYNSVGALTGVGTNLIGTDPNATTNVLSGISYNGFGAVKTLNYGNGRRLTLTYDVNRHQMQTMKVDNQNGTDTIINKSYSYTSQKWDPINETWMTVNDGRIQQITDSVDGNYTTNYSYDMYNRLTSATSTAANRSYTYNEWGNIKTVVSNGATKTYNYTNNASGAPATNRINTVTGGGTVSYTWDAAGNLTGEGATTYQYDAAGRMMSVNSGTGGSYGFDGDGKRVKKTEGGATVYYVESSVLGKTAFEVTSAGLNRALMMAGRSKVVALLATDGQFYWSHADHLGTGRKMTSTTGAVVYRGEFDPHGNSLLETGSVNLTNRKFTGYERDGSGLDYAQARMYAGNRGRFVSPDPWGIKAANFNHPQSLNRYAYGQNDPVNSIDPNGTDYEYICSQSVVCYEGFCEVVKECDESGPGPGPGGGGGGGGIITQPSRAEIIAAKRRDAYLTARHALEDSRDNDNGSEEGCYKYLAGQFGTDPIALLDTLYQNGQFGEGFSEFFGKPSTDNYNAKAVTDGVGDKAKIYLNPGNDTTGNYWVATYDVARFNTSGFGIVTGSGSLTPDQGLALIFLHELGHATGKWKHPDNDHPGESIDTGVYNQAIWDKCLKNLQ